MPIQYTQKRFTVLGENSKSAKENFDRGYDQIEWPNRPKPQPTTTAGAATPTPRE
jgi:hypothetical protein